MKPLSVIAIIKDMEMFVLACEGSDAVGYKTMRLHIWLQLLFMVAKGWIWNVGLHMVANVCKWLLMAAYGSI